LVILESNRLAELIWPAADSNRDNKLDEDEFFRAYRQLGGSEQEAYKQWVIMSQYSTDPDLIDGENMCLAWHGGFKALCHDDWQLMIRYGDFREDLMLTLAFLDSNKDEVLSPEELSIALPEEYVLGLLEYMDKNKDGQTTISESVRMIWEYEMRKKEVIEFWTREFDSDLELPLREVQEIFDKRVDEYQELAWLP